MGTGGVDVVEFYGAVWCCVVNMWGWCGGCMAAVAVAWALFFFWWMMNVVMVEMMVVLVVMVGCPVRCHRGSGAGGGRVLLGLTFCFCVAW